jgi:hypothetical protein
MLQNKVGLTYATYINITWAEHTAEGSFSQKKSVPYISQLKIPICQDA